MSLAAELVLMESRPATTLGNDPANWAGGTVVVPGGTG